MVETLDRIVVAGAGSVGCYVGGCLALAGRRVTLLGREPLMAAIARHGLRVTDLDGSDRTLPAGAVETSWGAQAALRDAKLVLVTVKSGATEEIAALIDRHAPRDAVVVSLQNGVRNAERLRGAMRQPRTVVAGMVPFNVVLGSGNHPHVHRATNGAIAVGEGVPGLAEALDVEGCAVHAAHDMQGILWGKLLLNLNNALNALSGLPLAAQLSDRRWRGVLARQMDEALTVMRKAGIRPAKLAAAPPGLLPMILRLPDWLFRRIASRMLAIDPQARSSMWDDLEKGRPTEIAEFQGTIAELARAHGIATPLTDRITQLVAQAEKAGRGSPALTPEKILL